MIRRIVVCMTLVLFAAVALAQAVAEGELQGQGEVEFQDFSGQYTRILSQDEIRALGQRLAGLVQRANTPAVLNSRYGIIHAVDPSEQEKFDADIFSLESASNIVNIRAIRTIIGAYLEVRYGYAQRDAFMLATFITYYNAVYRGNTGFFAGRYKAAVTRHLSPSNAGISTRYAEWPGATRVVIPLTGIVDTSELTDPSVIDRLREDQDKGVPLREHMVEFKEREIQRLIEETREKEVIIREREKELEDSEKQLDKDKDRLEERERELQRLREDAEKITDPVQRARELERIRELEKELERDRKDLEDRGGTIDRDRSSLDDDRGALDRDRERIAEKEDETQKDRDAIFADRDPREIQDELKRKQDDLLQKEKELALKEEELKKQQTDPRVFEGGFYYLKLKRYIPDGHYNNELFLIDPQSRRVMLSSPWKNIAGRQYSVFENGVVVIGYETAAAEKHFLVLLDTKDLSLVKKGEHDIYWRSFIEVQDKHIYAVFKDNGKFYLGRFNSALELTAKSADVVEQDTFIMFFQNFVYLNSAERKILVLDKNRLEKISTIDP